MDTNLPELPTETTEPIRDLVEALVNWGGQVSQIVAHMAANASPPRSGHVTAPEILHRLLWSVLEPALDGRSADDLLSAAAVVRASSATVAEEIVLVDLDHAPARGSEWRRSRRRHRRP